MTLTLMYFHRPLIWAFLFLLLALPALAQEPTATPDSDGVNYGGLISGQINDQNPRAVFFFDGLRGEVIAISLRATSGDLDPVLKVIDVNGDVVVNRDDSNGSRDVVIGALNLPRSSRYYVIIGRFGYGLGSTSGAFELDIQRIGVSSASGSALRVGDSVINRIDDLTPALFYSFRAEAGEILDIRMIRDSGDLDPYLQVVDSRSFLIADNDDVPGSGLNAEIANLVIDRADTYIIIATRYGQSAGTSSGRFVLSLERADGSGRGNSPQTAIPLAFGAVVEDEISSSNTVKYLRFEGRADDIISLRMTRTSNTLDALLVITDGDLNEIAQVDDSLGSQNAVIDNFRIPADGTYYVLATRSGRENGTTTGRFRLEYQSLGNAFDGVPAEAQRIAYGTTVTGRIDDITPQVLFAFFGNEGDAITVSLNRGDGDLDPVVSILSGDLIELTRDDDSGGGQNARIARYVIPRSGLYFIRASRFDGVDGNRNTQGSFVLVLAKTPV
jgi:hypothetical protein